MTKPTHSTLWILLALLLAAGCTSIGTGYGTTAAGTNPVRFDWKSSDDVSGTMYATLADGSVYAGSYFQITDTTTADTLGPLWDGWGSGWGFGGWDYWDTGTAFVTRYSGRVVANLADPDWRYVFVEEVGPVILHVASKGFIAALPIGTQRAPARPAIHMRGIDEPPRDRKLDRP